MIASWGQAGRQMPHRMQDSSTILTVLPSTATASAGQTRAQARQLTHFSGMIEKNT
jgi:hypothetical protein